MIREDPRRLKELIELSAHIAEVKDLDEVMERILGTARDFTDCDAGSIYIKQGDHLLFSYAQNDTLSSRLKSGEKLIYTTFKVPVDNNSIAGYVASSGKTLNLTDVYHLPPELPFSFDKSYDESANYRTKSMLTVPLMTINKRVVGVLQLINRLDTGCQVTAFETELEPYVNFFATNAAGALAQAQLTRTILLRMIKMAELRDPKETGNHVNRVAGYSVEIFETWAKKKGMAQKDIDSSRDVLRMAAMLHDVGKVAISDLILKKPGRLDDEEFAMMKTHTVLGARLFRDSQSGFEEAASEVALNHHEKWDGSGYPGHVDVLTGEALPGKSGDDGSPLPKKGEEISLYGRIVALADVYDALSSSRSYKKAWSEEKVLGIIEEGRGAHFDPAIVDAFMECLPTLRSIMKRYSG